jgi:hypothetical protein
MAKQKTARIRMLGCHWEYESGQEYDVDIDVANNLTGMGMAVLVESAPAIEEAKNGG